MTLKVERNNLPNAARAESMTISLDTASAPSIDRDALRKNSSPARRMSGEGTTFGLPDRNSGNVIPQLIAREKPGVQVASIIGMPDVETSQLLLNEEALIKSGRELLSDAQIRDFKRQWEAARGNGVGRGAAAAMIGLPAGLGGGAKDVVDGIRSDPAGFVANLGVEIGKNAIGADLADDVVDGVNTAGAIARTVQGIHMASNAGTADEAVRGLCMVAGASRIGGQSLTSLLLFKVAGGGVDAISGRKPDVDVGPSRIDADGRRIDGDGRRVDGDGRRLDSHGRPLDFNGGRVTGSGVPTGGAPAYDPVPRLETTPEQQRINNTLAHQDKVQQVNEQNFQRYQAEQAEAAQANKHALNQKVIDLDTPITIVTRPTQNFSSHGNTSEVAGARTQTTTLRKAAQGYEEGKLTYSDVQGAGLDVTGVIREARDSAKIQPSMDATYTTATGKYDLNKPSVRAAAEGKYPDGQYRTLGKPPEIGIEVENGTKLGGQYAALKAQERDYNRLVSQALEINKANNPDKVAIVFMRDLGGGIAGGYSPKIPTLYVGTPDGVNKLLESRVAEGQSLVDAGINGRMQDYNNRQNSFTNPSPQQTGRTQLSPEAQFLQDLAQRQREEQRNNSQQPPQSSAATSSSRPTQNPTNGTVTSNQQGPTQNNSVSPNGVAPVTPEAATLGKFKNQPELRGVDAKTAEALFDIIKPQAHYTGRLSPKYTNEMVNQAIEFGAKNPNVPVYFVQAEVPSNLGALNKKLGPQDVNNLMTQLAKNDQTLKDAVESKGGTVTITQGRGSTVNISISGLSQADAKTALDNWKNKVDSHIERLGSSGQIRNTDSNQVVNPRELRHPKNPNTEGTPEGINVRVSQLNPVSQAAGGVQNGTTAAQLLQSADKQLAWDFGNSGGRPAGPLPTGNFDQFSYRRFEELKDNLDDLRSKPGAPQTRFKDTFEEIKGEYMAAAKKAGLSPGKAEQLYKNNVQELDEISGALTADALDGTVGNAIKASATGKVSMMEIDVPNVGGSNATIGMKLTDEILAAPAMIVERELRQEGIPCKVIRAGGDEFVILAECSPEKMREIAKRAELEVAKLNSLQANVSTPDSSGTVRVGDAEHPKHQGNPAFYGTGLYSGIIELNKNMTPAEARKQTGDLVEKAKADKARASGEIPH